MTRNSQQEPYNPEGKFKVSRLYKSTVDDNSEFVKFTFKYYLVTPLHVGFLLFDV